MYEYIHNALFVDKCLFASTSDVDLTCVDIDECELVGICGDNAECFDTPGSYNCTCKAGYFASGDICEDIDECLNDPCDQNATCINYDGGFSCQCESSFRGDGFNCTRK